MSGKSLKMKVAGSEITVLKSEQEDYISITDIARHKNPEATGLVISHWLSTRYTIEFMGLWEKLHNPDFNVTEFRNIKNESLNALLIQDGITQPERLKKLNRVAIEQMRVLADDASVKRLVEK
jgi:hypothetical protein